MQENRGVKKKTTTTGHNVMTGEKAQLLHIAIFKSVRNENAAY